MDSTKRCSVDGCEREWYARDLCGAHYQKHRRAGPMPERRFHRDNACAVAGCQVPAFCRGWCSLHYQRWRSHGDPVNLPQRKHTCRVDDCERRVQSQGMCELHWERWKRTHDMREVMKPVQNLGLRSDPKYMSMNQVDRFWARVTKVEDDSCWEWIGYCGKLGYGKVRLYGRDMPSHRAAYLLSKGEIPDGLCVCHACDNRKCCNPSHLWLGTMKQNSQDMVTKGRSPNQIYRQYMPRGDAHYYARHPEAIPRGSQKPAAKLNEAIVLEARRRYAAGDATVGDLAKKYGVTDATMRYAVTGKQWRHVK